METKKKIFVCVPCCICSVKPIYGQIDCIYNNLNQENEVGKIHKRKFEKTVHENRSITLFY
jgi:hypothetical protein